jgi:drug/metabolite transporter (DMT)-like permease
VGELAAVTCSVIWAFASVLFYRAGQRLTASEMNFIKCAVGAVLMSLTLFAIDGVFWPAGLTRGETSALAASAVIGLALGDSLFFASLLRIGARRSLLASSLVPALTAAAAWVVLDEAMSGLQVLGATVTLGGVAWVLSARGDDEVAVPRERLLAGLLLALAASACQVVTNIVTKDAGSGASALGVGVVRLTVGAAALAVELTIRGSWRRMVGALGDTQVGASMGAGAFLGTYVGIWLMNYGLLHAEAGVASTLSSTSPIWILPVSAWLLRERVGMRAWIGASVAVAGIALLCLV